MAVGDKKPLRHGLRRALRDVKTKRPSPSGESLLSHELINEKNPDKMSGFNSLQSHSAGNLAAAQTTGACVGMLGGTIHDNLNALDVGLPSTVGASVRVAHLDAERNTLIAKFALCHLMLHLLA